MLNKETNILLDDVKEDLPRMSKVDWNKAHRDIVALDKQILDRHVKALKKIITAIVNDDIFMETKEKEPLVRNLMVLLKYAEELAHKCDQTLQIIELGNDLSRRKEILEGRNNHD